MLSATVSTGPPLSAAMPAKNRRLPPAPSGSTDAPWANRFASAVLARAVNANVY